MKKVLLFAAMITAITFTACQKEDNPVDVSQLVGKWHETGIIGSTENYTFYENGRYELVIASFPNGSIQLEGSYEVSDGRGITLFTENGNFIRGQYLLLELNSKEMTWKEVVYGGESRETKFTRLID